MKLGEDVVRSLAYKSAYQGKLYYFCSDECKREFERNPESYVSKAATGSARSRRRLAPNRVPRPAQTRVNPRLSPLLRGR